MSDTISYSDFMDILEECPAIDLNLQVVAASYDSTAIRYFSQESCDSILNTSIKDLLNLIDPSEECSEDRQDDDVISLFDMNKIEINLSISSVFNFISNLPFHFKTKYI